jgi:hypothetical protein
MMHDPQRVAEALLQRTARGLWGFDLRPPQLRAAAAAVRGHDVFAVLPCGAGKTNIWVAAALARGSGVLVVFVPLVALSEDLRRRLRRAGVDVVEWRRGGEQRVQLSHGGGGGGGGGGTRTVMARVAVEERARAGAAGPPMFLLVQPEAAGRVLRGLLDAAARIRGSPHRGRVGAPRARRRRDDPEQRLTTSVAVGSSSC